MSRNQFPVILAVLALCMSVLGATTRSTVATSAQEMKRPKPVDRTTGIVNRMTPTQRSHARLHQSRIPPHAPRTRLLDEQISMETIDEAVGPPNRPSAKSVITTMACAADAVFAGKVVGAVVLPTEDGTLLFTDHSVLVSELLRARVQRPIGLSETLVITRKGGTLTVEGVPVSYKLTSYPPLQVNRDYLFFVKHLRGTDTFDAEESRGVFALVGDTARALGTIWARDAEFHSAGVGADVLRSWIQGAQCK
jgi:hypothetical protein